MTYAQLILGVRCDVMTYTQLMVVFGPLGVTSRDKHSADECDVAAGAWLVTDSCRDVMTCDQLTADGGSCSKYALNQNRTLSALAACMCLRIEYFLSDPRTTDTC